MPPELQIFLLGSFRLLVKGALVPNAAWQKRRAKLFVQIIALKSSHEIHREELIEMLYPDADTKTANARFYRILHAARKVLEPHRSSYASSNFLVNDGEVIKLSANDDFWIDTKEFEQKAREGLKKNDRDLLESAAELYKGDLLVNEPFEEWLASKRERLGTLFHQVLRRLSEMAESRNEMEEAHDWLDKVLQFEPADEIAHRAKIRLFVAQGDTTLALRQYEKCRAELSRELAIEPDDETEQLRREILARKCR